MARKKTGAEKRSSTKKETGQMARRVRGKALFDFVSSPDYPEQASLSKDETFTVVEDFSDGWTRIMKASGADGVIPSSYYTKVPLTTLQVIQDTFEFVLARIGRIMGALFRLLLGAIFGLISYIKDLVYEHVVYPISRSVMIRFKNNETAQTLLSKSARKVYTAAFRTFLSELSDLELDESIAEVEDYIQMAVREERDRIPATRSSFVREPMVIGRSSKRRSKRTPPESLSTLLSASSPRSSVAKSNTNSRRMVEQE